MPYLSNINSYLHQSSLLLQAYPSTTHITTKYSLPRRQRSKPDVDGPTVQPDAASDATGIKKPGREQQPPAATLTLKTFEITAGICLKYKTNKSAEVGRLMTGLGRLAKGEIFEEQSAPAVGVETEELKAAHMMVLDASPSKAEQMPEALGGGGKARKRKGKK